MRFFGFLVFLLTAVNTGFAEDNPSPESSNSWDARAIIGFHQAGAASAESTQKLFIDFFTMRAIGNHENIWDSKLNLWGNVRVSSTPQQINAPLSDFVATFTEKLGAVRVNELAQSAEFQAGIEWSPEFLLGKHVRMKFTQGTRTRMLGIIGFYGAKGIFQNPAGQMQIFRMPAAGSVERQMLDQRFPAAGGSYQYVGFLPPERDQFYRFYGAGFRYCTFDTRKRYAPPATFTFTVGQDQAITEGRYKGVIGRFDVFYPLPIANSKEGKWQFVYLFGTANLRLGKPRQYDPVVLEPVASGSGGNQVQPFNSELLPVAIPSQRDTYLLGVGIDVVNLIHSWWPKKED